MLDATVEERPFRAAKMAGEKIMGFSPSSPSRALAAITVHHDPDLTLASTLESNPPPH
jgi:hypothetical protein